MLEKLNDLRKDLQEKFKQGKLDSNEEWTLSVLNTIKKYEYQIKNDNLSPEQILRKVELIQEICLIVGKDNF